MLQHRFITNASGSITATIGAKLPGSPGLSNTPKKHPNPN